MSSFSVESTVKGYHVYKGLPSFLTGKDLTLRSLVSPAFRLRLISARYFPFQVWTEVGFISTPNYFEKWWIAAVQQGILADRCLLFWCELGLFPSKLTASLWCISHSFVGVFNRSRANVCGQRSTGVWNSARIQRLEVPAQSHCSINVPRGRLPAFEMWRH